MNKPLATRPIAALAVLAVALGLGALAPGARGGPASPAEAAGFSHADWSAVLSQFVDSRGRVAYHALAGERVSFDRYIAAIEKGGPQSNPDLFPTRNDTLAYYLNAYNAMVWKGVLARGPEQHTVWTPFGSGYSFFVGMDIVVDGRRTTLKNLEDNVVRGKFRDPRVHAALNCASLGCPRLPQTAFLGPKLDEQLDAAMRELVSEGRGCIVDTAHRTVRLSKIFDWFQEDFLAYERGHGHPNPKIHDYLNRYRSADQQVPADYAVSYIDYDKRINAL